MLWAGVEVCKIHEIVTNMCLWLQVYDKDIDKVNKPFLPVASGVVLISPCKTYRAALKTLTVQLKRQSRCLSSVPLLGVILSQHSDTSVQQSAQTLNSSSHTVVLIQISAWEMCTLHV